MRYVNTAFHEVIEGQNEREMEQIREQQERLMEETRELAEQAAVKEAMKEADRIDEAR